jgi:DNA N-6-adenine-methyltransferase (Dam)
MTEQAVRYKAIATSSKSDCHNTPKQIIDAVLECFGGAIALDPCSNSYECPNVPATQLYTINNNGLSRNWVAETLYMNPPYSNTQAWATKLIKHVKAGDIQQAIALTKADNRTRWYADLMDSCDGFCLYRGYLKFGEAASSAPFASVIFYFGDRFDHFDRAFSDLGWVYATNRHLAVSERDRLLMRLGATEFRDRLLRGGSYSQLDDWAIEVANNLRSKRHELKKLGIELITADSASVCQVLGSLLNYYGFKTYSNRETHPLGVRTRVYRLKTATRPHCVDANSDCDGMSSKDIPIGLENSKTDINSRPHGVDTNSDREGEFSNRIYIAGDRAEIPLEDGLAMLVKIVEVLADGRCLCIDIAGRWRSPSAYHAHELQPKGTHQNLL